MARSYVRSCRSRGELLRRLEFTVSGCQGAMGKGNGQGAMGKGNGQGAMGKGHGQGAMGKGQIGYRRSAIGNRHCPLPLAWSAE
jgi:hypothetical protein